MIVNHLALKAEKNYAPCENPDPKTLKKEVAILHYQSLTSRRSKNI
jgi:hypothetical protein